MSVSRWLILLTLAFFNTLNWTSGQQCNVQLPNVLQVKETDPAGTEILKVNSPPGIQWSFSLDAPELIALTPYFNFSRSSSTQHFVMRLVKPLDIEEIKKSLNINVNVILLSLVCQASNVNSMKYIVPVAVTAVNEFPPNFNTSRINIQVNETTPVGRNLLQLVDWSRDEDFNFSEREINGFSLSPNDGTETQDDANDFIYVSNAYDGVLTLRKSLDYEKLPGNKKNLSTKVTVKDVGGKTGTAVLTMHVLDDDDLPPFFKVPGCATPCSATYMAEVSSNLTGIIDNITPCPIKATDGDGLNYSINYQIIQGPDDFDRFFQISSTSGEVTIVKALEQTGLKVILLTIEAKEVSILKRSSRASFLITVDDTLTGKPQGHLLLIVIVIAAVLLFLVVAIVTGWLSWRMRSKRSQVRPESGQVDHGTASKDENSDIPSLFLTDGRRPSNSQPPRTNTSRTLSDTPKQDPTTNADICTELSSKKSKTIFDTADVKDKKSFDDHHGVDPLGETEYAEVDMDMTSQWTTIPISFYDFQSQEQTDLIDGPSLTRRVDHQGYELPLDFGRRLSAVSTGRRPSNGYSSRPLPIPTNPCVNSSVADDDVNPYARVNKPKPLTRHNWTYGITSEDLKPAERIQGSSPPRRTPPPASDDIGIDIYDATKNYQELEVYLGADASCQTLVQRCLSTPLLHIDPGDNLYWTVVVDNQDDFQTEASQ